MDASTLSSEELLNMYCTALEKGDYGLAIFVLDVASRGQNEELSDMITVLHQQIDDLKWQRVAIN